MTTLNGTAIARANMRNAIDDSGLSPESDCEASNVSIEQLRTILEGDDPISVDDIFGIWLAVHGDIKGSSEWFAAPGELLVHKAQSRSPSDTSS
jgi:hypothetical protein